MAKLILLMTFLTVQAQANVTEVRLRHWAMVPPGPVTVADFLEPNAPAELRAQFSDLKLGEAPPADQKTMFSMKQISAALSKVQIHPGFRLVIPRKVSAEGQGLISSLKRSKELYEQDLEAKCFSLCRIETSGWEPPKILKQEPVTSYFEYKGLSSAQFPRQSFTQVLTLKRIGGESDQVWIQGSVTSAMEALVAKRFLQAGWRVQAEDFEMQTIEFSAASDTPILREALIGQKLGRNVGPGAILTAGMIERAFDVRFGQSVRAVVLAPNWKISFDGTARDNASIGDRIKVFNPATKKLFSGILREDSIVEIK